MTSFLLPTTTLAAGISSFYLYHAGAYLLPTSLIPFLSPPKISTQYTSIPQHLHASPALAIANQHNLPDLRDTRRVTLLVPSKWSDEEILARVVKGFFGGYVFLPERTILKWVKWGLEPFERTKHTPTTTQIWTTTQLSSTTLPPLHSRLFGVFSILGVDLHNGRKETPSLLTPLPAVPDLPLAQQQEQSASEKEDFSSNARTQSSIDVAFGTNGWLVAGVHRFSVFRDVSAARKDLGKEDGEEVTIEYACAAHSPTGAGLMMTKTMKAFHMWWAMVLFRNGVGEVLRK